MIPEGAEPQFASELSSIAGGIKCKLRDLSEGVISFPIWDSFRGCNREWPLYILSGLSAYRIEKCVVKPRGQGESVGGECPSPVQLRCLLAGVFFAGCVPVPSSCCQSYQCCLVGSNKNISFQAHCCAAVTVIRERKESNNLPRQLVSRGVPIRWICCTQSRTHFGRPKSGCHRTSPGRISDRECGRT